MAPYSTCLLRDTSDVSKTRRKGSGGEKEETATRKAYKHSLVFLIENPKDAYRWRKLQNTSKSRSNRLTLLKKESLERSREGCFFFDEVRLLKKPWLMSIFFSLWLNKNKWKSFVVS